MKPILVLKQQEIMPEVMNMASGAPSAMSSISPLAFVPLPSTTKDPISGRPLLAPEGAQYRTQYDIRGKETPFSDISAPKNQKQIRAMGHDPKTLAGMSSEELEGFLQRRAAKEAAKQSEQEVLSREMAQSGGNTQAAFEEALRRTGRGALAGKIGAGALAGLTGLMALQRANESGTDLISALGGAGAQGYSTYRYANPTLQSLGMRGAAKISPSVGVSLPLRPPNPADVTQQSKLGDFEGFDTGAATTQSVAPPTVAPPTTQSKLPGAPATPLSEEEYARMTGTEHGEMSSNRDTMTGASSIDEGIQDKFQTTLDEYGSMMKRKGNRRSFIGVR